MYRSLIFGLLVRQHCTHQRDASRWPADMQACLGIQGGSIFRDEATNAGAEMDHNLVGRCISLRDGFRALRNHFLPN